MINFKLKNVEKIVPIGEKPNAYLSWFWLTDGELWLKFGEHTLYGYSQEALEHFESLTPYNDYYIVRFLEDFTALFENINESIPDDFYRLTQNLNHVKDHAQKWLDLFETEEEQIMDSYRDKHYTILSWIYDRSFDSGHLIGGPLFSFFRCKNKIRIVWETDYVLKNGINLWTAKDGSFEMSFSDFIKEIKKFGIEFFEAMDKQIQFTISKEWEDIQIDKIKLISEHNERKLEFYKNLSLLEQKETEKTNWKEIDKLYKQMTNDLQIKSKL
ncbi:DUF5984 family protein [Flavobacterium sp.]|uniref:DUF5984 family protein n=1 Tax=Flavobacterium sp. TaxID=239 RepID=UPI0031CE0FD3